MTRQAQISIAASIVVHVLFLLVLAGVEEYADRDIEDKMLVTFVDERKIALLRRSIPVRLAASLDRSPRRPTQEQYAVQPGHRSSVEFYTSEPERVFSEVKSIGQDISLRADIQRRPVELQWRLASPIATGPRTEPQVGIRMQPRVSELHNLLKDMGPTLADLDPNAVDDALKRFAAAVHRRIESNKRYPAAAQNVGIEGRTGVRMTILKDGRLKEVEILDSSGYEILDKAALRSVRDAAPFPAIPDAAKMEEIEVSVYLAFNLS